MKEPPLLAISCESIRSSSYYDNLSNLDVPNSPLAESLSNTHTSLSSISHIVVNFENFQFNTCNEIDGF